MAKCVKCGAELAQDAKFCPQCGTKQPETPKVVFCTNCGAKLTEDARFCPSCGTPVTAAAVPAQSNAAAASVPSQTTKAEPASQTAVDTSSYESQDPEFFNKRGMQFCKDKDYDNAIEDFSKAVNLSLNIANPDDDKMRCRSAYAYNRGYTYMYKKEYTKAYTDFTLAVEWHKKNLHIRLYWRALAATCMHKYSEAIADFTAALEASEEFEATDKWKGNTLFQRAFAEQKIALFVEAGRDIEEAKKLDSENIEKYDKWAYNNVMAAGPDAFSSDKRTLSIKLLRFPDNFDCIDDRAFKGQKSLEIVKTQPTLTYLGESAFEDCSNLVCISIPFHIPEIKQNTFLGCGSLKYAHISEGPEKIGAQAFMNSGLEHIDIPESVREIESCAFFCPKSTSITIGANVKMKKDSFCENFQWDYKYQKKKAGTYLYSKEGVMTDEGDCMHWILQDNDAAKSIRGSWSADSNAFMNQYEDDNDNLFSD
jgi:tetratricopeptide (TPR) repeat protein